jgi:hypothetical protein
MVIEFRQQQNMIRSSFKMPNFFVQFESHFDFLERFSQKSAKYQISCKYVQWEPRRYRRRDRLTAMGKVTGTLLTMRQGLQPPGLTEVPQTDTVLPVFYGRNCKAHHRVQKSSQLVPIFSHMPPLHNRKRPSQQHAFKRVSAF